MLSCAKFNLGASFRNGRRKCYLTQASDHIQAFYKGREKLGCIVLKY